MLFEEPPFGSLTEPANPGALNSPLSSPQWLHPLSPFFDLLAHVRSFLFPLFFSLVGAARNEWYWFVIGAVLFFVIMLLQLVHFFTFRFWLTETDLVSRQGLIFVKTRTIPLHRIQNIDLVQNVLHRLLGVAEGRVETASGTEVEAILRVLSVRKLECLRDAIAKRGALLRHTTSAAPVPLTVSAEDSNTEKPGLSLEPATGTSADTATEGPVELLRLPVSRLVAAGLSNNRGLILIGAAIGGAYQLELFDAPWIKQVWNQIPVPRDLSSGALMVLVGFVFAVVGLRILSIAWYVTRFFDYRLVRSGDVMQVSCGLLTRVRSSIPRQRIQFISVQQNWLMRWFGHAAIRLETAGGAAAQESDATGSLTRKWFIPVIDRRDAARIINELRPDIKFAETEIHWHGPSSRTTDRLLRFASIDSVVLVVWAFGLTLWLGHWWTAIAAACVIPALFWWARRKAKSLYFARTDWGVIYRSGILARKLSVTFFDRIQVVSVEESPFDRRWGMATLTVDTAAAGAAEHRIEVPYLERSLAQAEFDAIRQQTSVQRLRWV